uniref:Uncharacterized protein n=1 Tax=Schistosoma mansoni TaxID=6183 RepID=A0A5K4F776_SCHMA
MNDKRSGHLIISKSSEYTNANNCTYICIWSFLLPTCMLLIIGKEFRRFILQSEYDAFKLIRGRLEKYVELILTAGAAWKLENEDTFRMNMDSYMGVNKTIVPNFCMTMLQQSSARNWDKNIQNNIAYGCEVLKKYSNWKWGARTNLDLMTIQWLVGSDKNSQSRYITDRGFDYCLKEKALQCSEDVMKIHRAKAEVNCISTTREYLELQRVKDTPNSKTQAIQFDKINENFNSSLIELKSKVENLEINRINYLKFMNPMERVISVIDAMEEEVDHKYGFYM